GGCFVEIGKAGIWTNARVAAHRPDVRYAPFDLADVARETPEHIRRLFADVAAGLASGTLQPIAVHAFDAANVTDAFRLVSRARHLGKVVVMLPRPDAAPSSGI